MEIHGRLPIRESDIMWGKNKGSGSHKAKKDRVVGKRGNFWDHKHPTVCLLKGEERGPSIEINRKKTEQLFLKEREALKRG